MMTQCEAFYKLGGGGGGHSLRGGGHHYTTYDFSDSTSQKKTLDLTLWDLRIGLGLGIWTRACQ